MNETGMTEKLLLTREEAAAALGIGLTKMKELLADGVIVSIKIGRLRRIKKTSLQEYIQLRALIEEQKRGDAE